MGRLNNDEQFKFLISCIRWSNNGKVTISSSDLISAGQKLTFEQVDFSEVAAECKIVTKGAA